MCSGGIISTMLKDLCFNARKMPNRLLQPNFHGVMALICPALRFVVEPLNILY